jgi:hypothetical protein
LIAIGPIEYFLVIEGADNLFFRRGDARYEGGAMILGSNPAYTGRGEVLRDRASIELLMDRF